MAGIVLIAIDSSPQAEAAFECKYIQDLMLNLLLQRLIHKV